MTAETPPPGYMAEPPCKVTATPLPPFKAHGWEVTTWTGEDGAIYLRLEKGKREPRVWWGKVPVP